MSASALRAGHTAILRLTYPESHRLQHAGSFSAAQFITSYGWGVLSDRWGRKVRGNKILSQPIHACHGTCTVMPMC